jgi:ATP-dependent RNA helicase SUPV3L1/SUV3
MAASVSSPQLEPTEIPGQEKATESQASAGAVESEGTGESAPEVIATESAASGGAEAELTVTPAEPDLIEVWRPGRSENREKRPHRRHHRREHRAEQRPPAEQQGVQQAGAPVMPPTAEMGAEPKPQESRNRSDERPHGPRPHRKDRGGRPRRHDGARDTTRHGKPEGRPRQDVARPRPERREREPDPNSPFAKLAALKARLEAESKERR